MLSSLFLNFPGFSVVPFIIPFFLELFSFLFFPFLFRTRIYTSEPRTQSVASSKPLEEDLISPGRLPRKSFRTKSVEETDDYEDENVVSTSERSDTGDGEAKKQDYAMTSLLTENSGVILELAAQAFTEKVQRNSPSIKSQGVLKPRSLESSPRSTRSTSPVTRSLSAVVARSVSPVARSLSPVERSLSPVIRAVSPVTRGVSPETRAVSPETRAVSPEARPVSPDTRAASPTIVSDGISGNLSRSRTPPVEKPPTPTRSPEVSDDSCHPSPEVPHRTVCAVPNPTDDQPQQDALTSLVISGGNLGGVANKGFSSDEHPTVEAVVNNNAKTEAPTEVDAGYKRVRTLDIDTQANVITNNTVVHPNLESQPNSEVEQQNVLPILFFLHGVGGSADIWSSQMQYFNSKGFHVIGPDMLGHGFSSCPDKPSAYTFTKLFKDFITIFDAYVPDGRKCVVIGHSYGCSFSAALARTRPEKVVSLIMIASGGPTPLAPPPNLYKYPKWIINFLRLALECKFRNQQHKYNPRGKTIKFKEAFDVPSYVFKYVMLGQVWPEGDAGFHRRISVPTLLVYGMRDSLVSLVEECEMERTIPKVITQC